MAWNGSGTFARIYNWVSRAANPATKYIDPTSMDAEFDNYKTGLENCLTKTGETTPTANQPMGNYRHTGVGAATALTDYARAGEVQKGTLFKAASPGGTIDAMTGTITPAPTLTAGQLVSIIAPGSGSNTVTNPTLALNGGSAVTIKKHQTALVAGDYTAGDQLLLLYDGTYFELLNPKYALQASGVPAHSTFTTDSTGGATDDLIPFIDTSESSADNKVTVSSFFTNVFANFTAKTTPVAADTLMIADSAASGAPKISTIQQIMNVITGLTAKSTPVVADSVMVADSAASGAAKYSTLQQIWNTLTGLTALTIPDFAADKIAVYDNSASATKYVLPGRLVSGGVLSKTATYAVAAADAGALVVFSGLSADVELQLPAAATCGDGFEITFRNNDSTYGVTVNPNSSETLDTYATRKTSKSGPITLVCDGTNWHTKNGSYTYISAEIATTGSTDGAVTSAHGLGKVPDRISWHLVCTATDGNFASGDRVWGHGGDQNTATVHGFVIQADATSIYYTLGAGYHRILNKTANTSHVIDTTKWNVVVVAEAF